MEIKLIGKFKDSILDGSTLV